MMKTLRQIEFDIDGYLRDGGRLLMGLEVVPSEAEKVRIVEWLNSLDPDERETMQRRITRVGLWLSTIEGMGDADDKIGEVLTEDQLRRLWYDR